VKIENLMEGLKDQVTDSVIKPDPAPKGKATPASASTPAQAKAEAAAPKKKG
jgi:ribosomal protein L12E/L44/L45/RPP1/RPP2